MPDDFYDLLGLSRDATQDDVKRAYREKVREYHPDLNDDPRAQAQFTALKKAYDTLGDLDEREDYDRMGHEEYVAKRINGLPSQDKWATGSSGSSKSSESSGTSRSSATAATASTTTGTATESKTSRAASTSASTDGHTATAEETDTTRTASSAGSNTASGTRRSGSTGRTASRRSRRRTDAGSTGILSRLRKLWRIGVGWPLIFVTDVLYVVGLELFVGVNQAAVFSGLEAVLASGTDADALRAALLEPPLGVVEFVTTSHYIGDVPIAGTVLVLGSVILPLVYGIVIHDTRTSFSAWNPTRLYVLAALGPAIGLAVNVAGFGRLGVDFVCFGLLPLGAIVSLPTSAFVRPWILRKGRR